MSSPAPLSRRHFLHSSSATLAAPAIITAVGTARAQQKADSQETLRIGLVGCGGRGTGAAAQALGADYNTRLVAVADVFAPQIDGAINSLSQKFPDRVAVDPDKRFVGLDAYQKLIASGVDVVLLASPPGFRPVHLQAAVEAGKHIFCEKPMAVDALGYHLAMAAVDRIDAWLRTIIPSRIGSPVLSASIQQPSGGSPAAAGCTGTVGSIQRISS
jgi:hypothetical protein